MKKYSEELITYTDADMETVVCYLANIGFLTTKWHSGEALTRKNILKKYDFTMYVNRNSLVVNVREKGLRSLIRTALDKPEYVMKCELDFEGRLFIYNQYGSKGDPITDIPYYPHFRKEFMKPNSDARAEWLGPESKAIFTAKDEKIASKFFFTFLDKDCLPERVRAKCRFNIKVQPEQITMDVFNKYDRSKQPFTTYKIDKTGKLLECDSENPKKAYRQIDATNYHTFKACYEKEERVNDYKAK